MHKTFGSSPVCDLVLCVADDDRGEVLAHVVVLVIPDFFPDHAEKSGMVGTLDHAVGKRHLNQIPEVLGQGQFGAGKASGFRAASTLYASTPSSFREVACVHNRLACSHAFRLLSFQGLSRFWLGT